MDVKFIDASKWTALEWYNSGGTRAKRVLQSPDGEEWYFKCSEKKPAKDNKPEKYYRYEFWSEIIAYQLGKLLGLDILRYDIAIHDNQIGCISPLMIKRDEEQLIEVGRYMTALNPAFLPEDYSTRNEYTFQLLEKTVEEFNLTEYWHLFFQTILFDAIIGNTDRHQENWAFLGKNTFITNAFSFIEEEVKLKGVKKLNWFIKRGFKSLFDHDKNEFTPEGKEIQLKLTNLVRMAPIYDNGSSLGRELTDGRIDDLLKNEKELLKYVENGKAEVHWHNKKLTHFEFIDNLLNSSYLEQIKIASTFLTLWNETKVNEIINFIDKDVPDTWHSYCIPASRKTLMFNLLVLRSEKLRGLINDRV